MALLNLFRKNDPFLNIILLIVLVLARLAYSFFGQSNFEEIDATSSYLFDVLSFSSDSTYINIWISGLFLGINMLLINSIIRNNEALSENNYLGGFIYLIITNSSEKYFVLSGALVASTCLLLALSMLLSHVKQRASEENIFFTGVLIGLSVLFYSPMSIFLILTLLVYVLYTRTIQRRYILSSFGFCFPFILYYSVSLFGDDRLTIEYFFSNLFSNGVEAADLISYAFLIFPLALLLSKLLTSFGGLKMSNHQIHFHRLMFLVFISSVYVFFAIADDGFIWIIAIPATYFLSKSVLEINRNWIKTAVFYLLIAHLSMPFLSAAYF